MGVRIRIVVFAAALMSASAAFAQLGAHLSDTTQRQIIRSHTSDSIVSLIEHDLGLRVIYDTFVISTWEGVEYSIPQDTNSLLRYVIMLKNEFGKYPPDYFRRININKLALGTRLSYYGQNRAAVPDPYKNTLYLAIDGAYSDSSDLYLIHVMHHELHHCTEYALWQDMYYRWKEWRKINPCLFRYKGAGEMAYDHMEIDWYSMDHPKRGFINLYSTTGQEEDRSEIVADIMSDLESQYVIKYCKTDKRLLQKVQLMIEKLNEISGTRENFWTDKMKDLISK